MVCRLVGLKPLSEPMLEYRQLEPSEILSQIYLFSFNKMHLKMSSAKWRQFWLGLNMLISVKGGGTVVVISPIICMKWLKRLPVSISGAVRVCVSGVVGGSSDWRDTNTSAWDGSSLLGIEKCWQRKWETWGAVHGNHPQLCAWWKCVARDSWECCIELLWSSDAIWLQKSRPTLTQVVACCLTAASHYLNQY